MADSTSFPAQISAAEAKLPAEIAAAIEEIVSAAYLYGYKVGETYDFDPDTRRSIEARAALDTAILARLTAAESARDDWLRRYGLSTDVALDAIRDRDAAEAQLSAALARAERLEKALDGAVRLLNNGKDAASDWVHVLTEDGELRVQPPPGCVGEPHAALAQPAPAEETKL